MSQPRIGLLGCGRIGIMHAGILAPRVGQLLVADPRAERTQMAAERHGAVPLDVEELLSRRDLDGLVIATPTDTHADLICRAASLGVPIFCEKPVALDLESTQRANAAARAAGIPVHIGFQRHFDTAYATARKRLAEGAIGQLRRVSMGTLDQAPAAREFLAASGGIFKDCLIHDFDALRWVTGLEVEEVFAYGTDLGLPDFTDFGDVAETVVTLRMSGGVLVTAHSSRFNGAGYDVRMELHGTKGTDVVGMDERLPVTSLEPGVTYPHGEPWVDFIARFQDCYERELEAFLEVVAGRAEVPATIDDAVASLRIAIACGISLAESRPVRVEAS
ncbi:MAG: Gfo/Idh/MocA family oxidoreductase [Actinomycetaceae bacterium]|nr:Gfo/Idh/MocA family oxidoreductase [Actinomycetaceae bacterium]